MQKDWKKIAILFILCLLLHLTFDVEFQKEGFINQLDQETQEIMFRIASLCNGVARV